VKKTMMYLPEDMHRWLAGEAEARGTSMAEIVREAVGEYQAKTGTAATPKRGVAAFIGLIDDPDGPTDLVERMDEYEAEYYKPGGLYDQEHGYVPPGEELKRGYIVLPPKKDAAE
jgi:hypothetical protein